MEPVSRESFRDGMARLGAAVSVITTAGPAGRCGFTASSLCSVSDSPPTLLVCMNRASAMNAVFQANGVLCVNALKAGQEDLSAMFAGTTGDGMEQRFASAAWKDGATGAPVLLDAIVSFDCRISEVKEVGTHSVLFATVLDLRHEDDPPSPLIYFNRGYAAVSG